MKSTIQSVSETLELAIRIHGTEQVGWEVQAHSDDNAGLTDGQIAYRMRRLHGLLARDGHDLDALRTWGRSWHAKSHGASFYIYA